MGNGSNGNVIIKSNLGLIIKDLYLVFIKLKYE